MKTSTTVLPSMLQLPAQSNLQYLRGLSDYHSSSSSMNSVDHLYSPNVWWFVLALVIILLFAVLRVYICEAMATRKRWGSVQSRKKLIRSLVVAKTVIADTDPKASKYLSQTTFESAVSSLEEEEPTTVGVTLPAAISPDYVPPTSTTVTMSQTEEPNTTSTAPPPEDMNSSTKSNPRTLKRKKTNLVVHETREHHSVNKKGHDGDDDSSASSPLQDDDGYFEDDAEDKVDDDDYDSLACQICLNRFQVGDKICWSHNPECVHTFHMDCLEHWLLDKDHCPLCRQPYLVAPEVDDARVTEEGRDIETGAAPPAVHREEMEGVAVTCRLIPFAALVDRLSAIPRHHCHATTTGSGAATPPQPDTPSADPEQQQEHHQHH